MSLLLGLGARARTGRWDECHWRRSRQPGVVAAGGRTLRCVSVAEGHDGCINCLNWDEDGRLLATGSDDTTVRLWRYNERAGTTRAGLLQPIATLSTGHRGNIFAVNFVPGFPQFVLSGAADGTVRLCDADRPRLPLVRLWRAHQGMVHEVLPLTPAVFVSVGGDGQVRLFDLRERTPVSAAREFVVARFEHALSAADFHPSHREWIVVAGRHSCAHLLDLRGLSTTAVARDSAVPNVPPHPRLASGPPSSSPTTTTATRSRSADPFIVRPTRRSCHFADFDAGRALRPTMGREVPTSHITGVRFSPDGHRLATTSTDGRVAVFDLHGVDLHAAEYRQRREQTRSETRVFEPHNDPFLQPRAEWHAPVPPSLPAILIDEGPKIALSGWSARWIAQEAYRRSVLDSLQRYARAHRAPPASADLDRAPVSRPSVSSPTAAPLPTSAPSSLESIPADAVEARPTDDSPSLFEGVRFTPPFDPTMTVVEHVTDDEDEDGVDEGEDDESDGSRESEPGHRGGGEFGALERHDGVAGRVHQRASMRTSGSSTTRSGDQRHRARLLRRKPHRLFIGAVNSRTVKEVGWLGRRGEVVLAGSDTGHLFAWRTDAFAPDEAYAVTDSEDEAVASGRDSSASDAEDGEGEETEDEDEEEDEDDEESDGESGTGSGREAGAKNRAGLGRQGAHSLGSPGAPTTRRRSHRPPSSVASRSPASPSPHTVSTGHRLGSVESNGATELPTVRTPAEREPHCRRRMPARLDPEPLDARWASSLLWVARGDRSIVNCVRPHPKHSSLVVATSGIDASVKLWRPQPPTRAWRSPPSWRWQRAVHLQPVPASTPVLDGAGGTRAAVEDVPAASPTAVARDTLALASSIAALERSHLSPDVVCEIDDSDVDETGFDAEPRPPATAGSAQSPTIPSTLRPAPTGATFQLGRTVWSPSAVGLAAMQGASEALNEYRQDRPSARVTTVRWDDEVDAQAPRTPSAGIGREDEAHQSVPSEPLAPSEVRTLVAANERLLLGIGRAASANQMLRMFRAVIAARQLLRDPARNRETSES